MENFSSVPILAYDIVLSHFWDFILRQSTYTHKLEENLKALTVELEKLKAEKDDVKRAVDHAENQLMKRSSQVQLWLSRVQIVVAEADELIKDGPQEIRKLRFPGCFSKDYNYMSNYKFGKQMSRKLEEVVDLKNEGDFHKVADDEPIPPVDVRPIEPTVGLESKLVRVWHLLEGNDASIIGLPGMGPGSWQDNTLDPN